MQDMTLSNTVNEEFRVHLNNTSTNLNGVRCLDKTHLKQSQTITSPFSQVDMSVRVLTTGFWPGQTAPPHINLPRIPAQVLKQPTNFVQIHTRRLSRPLTCSRTSTWRSTAGESSPFSPVPALQTLTPCSLVTIFLLKAKIY